MQYLFFVPDPFHPRHYLIGWIDELGTRTIKFKWIDEVLDELPAGPTRECLKIIVSQVAGGNLNCSPHLIVLRR